VVAADAVEKGPIAKARTGIPLRSQVHGAWVSREKLDASKLK
jgi:carotenoid cleavage dioxygenase